MEEAKRGTGWKLLADAVRPVVEGIREARTLKLIRECPGAAVTIDRNGEIAAVGIGGCRDLGDSEEKPRPKPGELAVGRSDARLGK